MIFITPRHLYIKYWLSLDISYNTGETRRAFSTKRLSNLYKMRLKLVSVRMRVVTCKIKSVKMRLLDCWMCVFLRWALKYIDSRLYKFTFFLQDIRRVSLSSSHVCTRATGHELAKLTQLGPASARE